MDTITAVLLPVALFAALSAAYIGCVYLTQWWFVVRKQRRSRDRGLLREPARALSRRLEAVNHRLVGAAIGIPAALFLWQLVYQHALQRAGNDFALLALALAGAAALGWFGQELLRLWPERHHLRQAIDAQWITAQSLALLMRQGYWVFHDVHVGDQRINHLVLGLRGIFCVDTKARRVRRRWGWTGAKPAAPARVAFDGERLHFPGWTERESLTHVEQQADCLRTWLSEATSEPEAALCVHAAVALPGWRVASTHWQRLIVFNPATPNMLVQGSSEGARLDPSTAHDLVRRLQTHCRERTEARLQRYTRSWHERLLAALRGRLSRPLRSRGAKH